MTTHSRLSSALPSVTGHKQPTRIATFASFALFVAFADVFTPLCSPTGLVNALSTGLTDRVAAWYAVVVVFGILATLSASVRRCCGKVPT